MVGIKHGTTGAAGTTLTATLWNEAHTLEGVARAYCSTNQSINDITYTKVQLDTETFDPDSVFDHSANYRYSPATAGYYLVIGCVRYASPEDQAKLGAHIYKTGVSYTGMSIVGSGTSAVSCYVSDIVYLGATDYIELYAYHDSSGAETLAGGETLTYMAITPLRV